MILKRHQRKILTGRQRKEMILKGRQRMILKGREGRGRGDFERASGEQEILEGRQP